MHNSITVNHLFFIAIIILHSIVIESEAGILDWFRTKPKWYPKLERTPLIEAFHPKGIRISIGDFDGLQIFDFHGKINDHFRDKYDNGTIKFTIEEPKNGRWTYINKDIELQAKDVFYYWFYIKVNGEQYWSSKSVKIIYNIAPYPGENLQFEIVHGRLCPCDSMKYISETDLFSHEYQQCDINDYRKMKKELDSARVQINVLLETLLLLQKSDKNAPTLILTGKSDYFTDPKEDVKRFLTLNLDLHDIEEQVREAHYTDCGVLFEMESLLDVERILIAAERSLNVDDERQIYEPEKAICNKYQQPQYKLMGMNDPKDNHQSSKIETTENFSKLGKQ